LELRQSLRQANDQIQEHLQALLRELPFQAVSIDNEKQLPYYDTGAAELRTDERMARRFLKSRSAYHVWPAILVS
jgi:hypothetical protein